MARRKPSLPDDPVRMPPDHTGVLVAAVVMMVVGWLGLALLVLNTRPRIGAELWLFFLLLHVAITGTVAPFVRYLNVRFTHLDDEPPPGGVVVRQSVWIALYVVICAWLQVLRLLTPPIAVLLPLVFIVIEVFLRSRELDE